VCIVNSNDMSLVDSCIVSTVDWYCVHC
jgi:hypothetical protein